MERFELSKERLGLNPTSLLLSVNEIQSFVGNMLGR